MRRLLIQFLILFAAIFSVMLARDPGMLLAPIAHCEDGMFMMSNFYDWRHPRWWLIALNGQTTLLPNMMGWAAMRFPIEWTPLLLALPPMLVWAAAMAAPAFAGWRAWIPSDRWRIGVFFALAAAPFGNYALAANTTYSSWVWLWLVLMLAPAPLPRSNVGLAAYFGFTCALIASHALSIVAAPVHLALAIGRGRRDWRAAAFFGGLLLASAAYQLTLVDHNVRFTQTDWMGAEDGLPRPTPQSIGCAAKYLTDRVVFEAAAGSAGRMWVHEHISAWAPTAGGISILLATGALLTLSLRGENGEARFRGWILIYYILALTFLSVLGRDLQDRYFETPWSQRYFLLQKMMLAALIGGAIARLWPKSMKAPAAWTALGALVLWLITLNLADRQFYRVSREKAMELRSFVENVAEAEERLGGRAAVSMQLDRNCVILLGGDHDRVRGSFTQRE